MEADVGAVLKSDEPSQARPERLEDDVESCDITVYAA